MLGVRTSFPLTTLTMNSAFSGVSRRSRIAQFLGVIAPTVLGRCCHRNVVERELYHCLVNGMLKSPRRGTAAWLANNRAL